jgi:hypothetical protein
MEKGRIYAIWIWLIGALFCTTLYLAGVAGPYLVDDQQLITGQEEVFRSAKSSVDYWKSKNFGLIDRGVSQTSFYFQKYICGYESYCSKGINVVIHILNSAFLYFFIRKVLIFIGLEKKQLVWIASLASVLFMIHPLFVSTVLYAIQRMTLLSGSFVILSGICSFNVFQRSKLNAWIWSALFLMSLLIATMSKENGVAVISMPIILLLLNKRIKQNVKINFVILIFLSCVVLCLLFFERLYNFILSSYNLAHFDISERLLTQPGVWLEYIRLIVFPCIGSFGFFRDDVEIVSSIESKSFIVPFLVLMLVLFASIWAAFCKNKIYQACGFGMIWFFTFNIIEGTVFGIEMMYEHRAYIPSIGVILTGSVVLYQLFVICGRYKVYLLAAVFLYMSLLSGIRALQWSELTSLMYTELDRSQQLIRPRIYLAKYYYECFNRSINIICLDRFIKTVASFDEIIPEKSAMIKEAMMLDYYIRGKSNKESIDKQVEKFTNAIKRNRYWYSGFSIVDSLLTDELFDSGLSKNQVMDIFLSFYENESLSRYEKMNRAVVAAKWFERNESNSYALRVMSFSLKLDSENMAVQREIERLRKLENELGN